MAPALMKELEIHEEDICMDRFFTVAIGKVAYGIEINYITKIMGLHEMIRINGLHNNVKGVISFQDRIIPVIDARIKFKKGLKPYNDESTILVIEIKKNIIGIITDSANEVLNMDIVINYLVMMNLIKLQ